MAIRELEPKIVWKNFYELTQIPRPSKHEEKVAEYLVKWGEDHGFETIKDKIGNVIIRVPASEGYENRKGVILQGHMDMVPQKTADTVHDFLKDPIKTKIEDGWVTAEGTTLGADDGIGVALALAILEDDTLKHGPIEVLATMDEETGMTGAINLEPGILKGDILINIDSETEGELYIGCAGGLDALAEFDVKFEEAKKGYESYQLTLKKFNGGHSGMDIILYRANANKAMARLLLPLTRIGVEIVSMNGGSLRNAIPYEAIAELLIPEDKVEDAKAIIENVFAEIKDEYKETDPSPLCLFDKVAEPYSKYIETATALSIVRALLGCPCGVDRMSAAVEGLVETSNNMAVVKTEGNTVSVMCLMRSSVDTAKAYLAEKMRAVFELAGAKFTLAGGYSGWAPKPDAPIIQVMKDNYKNLFGNEPAVMAIHAGLECALLGATYPNWDMVSFGPTIRHPHSPDEKVNIETVDRAWKFLREVIANFPTK